MSDVLQTLKSHLEVSLGEKLDKQSIAFGELTVEVLPKNYLDVIY